jgi:hypothetical protein
MKEKQEPSGVRTESQTIRKNKHFLADRAEAELSASDHRELRHVRCEFQCGTLMLSGQVSSFYLKQIAQTLVSGIGEVLVNANGLAVRYPEQATP